MAFGAQGYEPVGLPRTLAIPHTSDFYHLKSSGRTALPESQEQRFIERFRQATAEKTRDYSQLFDALSLAASDRGYTINHIQPNHHSLSDLYRQCNRNTELYCDVIAAAINACPSAEQDIYL